jgi:hypothetical protein
MRRIKQKRSQIEIMGLMIVVILLIVGVLFAIKFVVLKQPPQVRQTFTRTQMASNMGIALMSSTTEDCRGTAIRDLMIDCAEFPEDGGTISCDDYTKSCNYVNRTVYSILNSTLTTWKVRYYFTAGTAQDQILYFDNGGCTADRRLPGESESFFLPTNRGLLTMKIFICQ